MPHFAKFFLFKQMIFFLVLNELNSNEMNVVIFIRYLNTVFDWKKLESSLVIHDE